jgi:hypothetical protein
MTQTGGKWISVHDKQKPPARADEECISVDILLYVPIWGEREKQPVVMGNYLVHSNKFRPSGSSGWENAVTHWMLLPEPPND